VTTNNEASTFVTVRAGGINVLYLVGAKRIGGGPGREQRFVRSALAASPDVVVERRLIDYEPPEIDLEVNGAESGVARTTGEKPDVIILDDVDAQGLSAGSWRAIAERVRKGAGLMMLGGYHSFGPGGFRETPLVDVLPVNIGPAQRQMFGEPVREDVHLPGPVRMRPAAPLGTRHPIMQLEGSGFRVQGSVLVPTLCVGTHYPDAPRRGFRRLYGQFLGRSRGFTAAFRLPTATPPLPAASEPKSRRRQEWCRRGSPAN
jgi:hypothetical protein